MITIGSQYCFENFFPCFRGTEEVEFSFGIFVVIKLGQYFQGLEFYEEETARYSEEFEKEKEKSLRSPLGIAFVTFKTLAMSKEVYDAFRRSVFQFRLTTPDSSLSSILKPEKWRVQFAPEPTDIYWENLSVSGFQVRSL